MQTPRNLRQCQMLERAIAEQALRQAAQLRSAVALDQCIKPPPAPAAATSA